MLSSNPLQQESSDPLQRAPGDAKNGGYEARENMSDNLTNL